MCYCNYSFITNVGMYFYSTDNPKQTTRATVYILILDVNDNAPQFAMFYDTFVCENARPGQVILFLYQSHTLFKC